MIDFEEDVPDSDVQRLQQGVGEVGEGVRRALATASKGRLLTAGLQVSWSPTPASHNGFCLCHITQCSNIFCIIYWLHGMHAVRQSTLCVVIC